MEINALEPYCQNFLFWESMASSMAVFRQKKEEEALLKGLEPFWLIWEREVSKLDRHRSPGRKYDPSLDRGDYRRLLTVITSWCGILP